MKKWEPVDWKDYWAIPLTKGQYTIIDKESYDLIKNYSWCISCGYAVARTEYGVVAMHRVIMGIASDYFKDKDIEVDHKNFIKLDNRIENLRICTRQENTCSQQVCIRNTSGYRGVTWNKYRGRWHAQIKYKGKHIHIGYYIIAEEASRAYESKAKELFGNYYNLIS